MRWRKEGSEGYVQRSGRKTIQLILVELNEDILQESRCFNRVSPKAELCCKDLCASILFFEVIPRSTVRKLRWKGRKFNKG